MIKLNGVPVYPNIFPDNTSQIWKINNINKLFNIVLWEFESENEIIHIAQLKSLLYYVSPTATNILKIPYFPYARQDKLISNETTFAKAVFAGLLETMQWNQIKTFDVHSEVYNNTRIVNIKPNIAQFINEYDCIIFPDEGAKLRYWENAKDDLLWWAQFNKSRNQNNGHIEYNSDDNFWSLGLLSAGYHIKKILIVDDICDGGATFVKLVELIKSTFPDREFIFDLYVSHGIFSKGREYLHTNGINKIITKEYTDEYKQHFTND